MSSSMKLFGRALKGNDYPDYKSLLDLAVKKGYIVHESCNTNEVKQFLDTKPDRKDFTQTFYKTWTDIKEMSRYEQFVDQIVYYYTGFNPNNLVESELPKVLFENLKPILPITAEEACAKCEDMLASGIALAKDTIHAIFDIFDKCKYEMLNINKIKNREARIIAFKRLNRIPTDPNEFLRYLIYLVTEDTMLIKNRETLSKITKSAIDVSALINSFGIAKLSSIYGRYKLIFMAFKHANKNNIACINKLTKKSKKSQNKSAKLADDSNYFQTLLAVSGKEEEPLDEVKLGVKLTELNNYKKIALLETINMYLMLNQNYRVFTIRNSKIWVKLSNDTEKKEDLKTKSTKKQVLTFPLPFKAYNTSKKPFALKNTDRLNKIYAIIYESLVANLRNKYLHANVKSFRLPEKCTLTAPKSEKAFIGEYPFGSSLSLTNSDLVIGISWDVEDNARDLDLSLLNMDNNMKIGWNSSFKDSKSKILFSGDIVHPPGTELFYADNGFNFDSGVYINLYGAIDESKPASFKFYVASEKIDSDKMVKNYMINPNNVKFSTKITMESKEMLIGFLTSEKFIFSTFRSNDSRVSRGNKYSAKLIEFNLAAQKCHLDLRKLLVDAGFHETKIDLYNETEDYFKFDSKSDIIGFFQS